MSVRRTRKAMFGAEHNPLTKDVIMSAGTLRLRIAKNKNPKPRKKPGPGQSTSAKSASASMSCERLMRLAKSELDTSMQFEIKAHSMACRSALSFFRAGQALSLVYEKATNEKNWVKLQDDYNIPRTTAWECLELFKRAGSESAVDGFTIAEALKKFKIRQSKKNSAAKATSLVSNQAVCDDSTTAAEGEATDARPPAADDGKTADREGDDAADPAAKLPDDVNDTPETGGPDPSDVEPKAEKEEPTDAPLEAIDAILAWLEILEQAIKETTIEPDSRAELCNKIEKARKFLYRIDRAVKSELI